MASMLTLAEFKARTLMPSGDVDALEAIEAGFLLKRLTLRTSQINGRLKKRYPVPFASPVPEAVLGWLTDLVTLDAYLKRGFNPSSEQDAEIAKRAEKAEAEVLEAANGETGLIDLPLLETAPSASGVEHGAPLGESQASPYSWTDVQAEEVRA